MKLNPAKLGFLFFIAAALWTPPLVWFAQKTGDTVMEKFQKLHHQAGWIAAGLLLGIFLFFHFVMPAFTWRGRRQLLSKGRVWTNHALMPGWILRLPGALHALTLALRHRSFSAYAAANPTLGRLGGATGESKSALLAPFAGAPGMLPFEKVPTGARRPRPHGNTNWWPDPVPRGRGRLPATAVATRGPAYCSRVQYDCRSRQSPPHRSRAPRSNPAAPQAALPE
jgi:hypothetical protein